jgi:hypothetical protein
MRLLCFLACACVLQGCSYAFVNGPPDNYQQSPVFDCTTSKVAPVLDTLGAGYQIVRAGVAVAADENDYADYPISRGADIALGIGFATLLTASAIYGYSETLSCQDAKAERAAPPPALERGPMPMTYAPVTGCSVDTQCKGNRVCEAGRCVDPPPRLVVPPPPAAPAPSASAPPETNPPPPAVATPPPAAPAPSSP